MATSQRFKHIDRQDGESLFEAFARGLSESLAPVDDQPGYALPSATMAWRDWLARYYPHIANSPFAARHIALWEWFERIERGVYAEPRLEFWPRGGAKSSTLELCTCRVGVKLTRRFALIVSGIQDQADSHVQSITTLLEQCGAQPSMSLTGRPRAWRRNQLRTANGFNVAAFGLDAASRGIKIDQYRPDIIILDDVDSREDSLAAVEKKIRAITQSILPTGSTDCIVVMGQNVIHANSIACQFLDGRAKFLLDREVATVEPAIMGLKTEMIEHATPGRPAQYRITGGVATWEGQSLKICETQINKWSYDTFLRESQHDVRHGGEPFFPMWEGVDFGGHGIDGRHIVTPFDLPKYVEWFAGVDEGWNAPFAYVLMCVDLDGIVYVVDEIVKRHRTPYEQALEIKEMNERYGIAKITILADPSMWAKKVTTDGIGPSPVEKYFAAGLNPTQANNNREHGWDNLRQYLNDGAMLFFKGSTARVQENIARAVHSKLKTEDVDDTESDIPPGHSDPLNALRYGCMYRLRLPSGPEKPPLTQQEQVMAAMLYRVKLRPDGKSEGKLVL